MKKVSKNARTVSVSSKTPQLVGDVSIVCALNQGRHARVLDVTTGRNLHLATEGPEFVDAVRSLEAAGYGARVRTEVVRLADRFPDQPWKSVLDRLDAEVFATAE